MEPKQRIGELRIIHHHRNKQPPVGTAIRIRLKEGSKACIDPGKSLKMGYPTLGYSGIKQRGWRVQKERRHSLKLEQRGIVCRC